MVKIRITQSLALLKTFFGSMWLIFKLVPPAMPRSFPAGLPGTYAVPSLMSKASCPKRHFLLERKIARKRGKMQERHASLQVCPSVK